MEIALGKHIEGLLREAQRSNKGQLKRRFAAKSTGETSLDYTQNAGNRDSEHNALVSTATESTTQELSPFLNALLRGGTATR